MFKKCGIINIEKNIDNNPNTEFYTKKNRYTIQVIDDDFSEEIKIDSALGSRAVVHALIKVYSDKNLNVGKNLFLFMRDNQNKSKHIVAGGWSIDEQINLYVKEIDEFKDYLKEIRKYLILN